MNPDMLLNMTVANTPRMKTRDRILAGSLALFNEQGERAVSTNHIAAALSISPGNLYYHFANKEAIIFELFQQYAVEMRGALLLPDDRPLTQDDKVSLFEQILAWLWRFRFLHRDMTHLLDDNPSMRDAYREFAAEIFQRVRQLYRLEIASGLVEASEEEISALVINIWIIATNWVNFLGSTGLFDYEGPLTEHELRQGLYQVICLEAPYLRGAAREGLAALKARYGGALLPA